MITDQLSLGQIRRMSRSMRVWKRHEQAVRDAANDVFSLGYFETVSAMAYLIGGCQSVLAFEGSISPAKFTELLKQARDRVSQPATSNPQPATAKP